MKLILIGVLITLFTNTIMAQNTNKNKNWKRIMTSNEAYTYTPPQKKKKSIWDNDWFKGNPAKRDYIIKFSKGGKVK